MISDNGDESRNIRTISLPNFDISWAGASPGKPGYWFGSDDGQVLFMSLDETDLIGPHAIAPSDDAVNGIAFAGNLMAVSTRSDVTFLSTPEPGQRHIARTVFHGGAHGVASTRGGCIIGPMGRRGILLMDPRPETAHRVRILKPADEALYIYKVVSLASPNRGTILACAGRQGGFATMPLAGAGIENYGRKLRPAGVDFVDVAALDVDGFPFAVAALGLDCSIHFVGDVLRDLATTILDISSSRERAYRILCAEGHVFMLTDKSLYAFKDLAVQFLRGETTNNSTAQVLDLEAVDASLGPDRSLLVVMPDSVYRIEIDSILAGLDPRISRQRSDSRTDMGTKMLPTDSDDESWE
ncbi:MAG TPA: hypothetical protein VKA15_10710, partial [Isosphaeraceae bacterium]|nr:hypothetical protein [Isosphaeraceae bacterium]